MSTTSSYKDFSDLKTGLLNRVREDTGATATVTQAARYINIALNDMNLGFEERFPWLERQSEITTQAKYTTGTVTITQGSSTLTGSGTAWATANSFGVNNVRTQGKLVINGTNQVYRISSVDSDTSITLASAYTGADVSAGTFLYYEDEYDLHADFLRPLNLRSFDLNHDIMLLDRATFQRQYVRVNTTGKPSVATIVDRAFEGNTLPVRRVKFYQPPDANYTIPYAYITNKYAISSAGVAQDALSEDSDEPIVPYPYRHGIVLHALYNWYRDKKDDDRSREAKAEYVEFMTRLVGNTEIGERRPRIQPRMGQYRRNSRNPYNVGARGRYVTGDAFDTLRDR